MKRYSVSYDPRSSYRAVKSFFEDVCRSAHSPLSEKVFHLSREGKDYDLALIDIVPSDYSDAETFRVDYSIIKFLSKWKGLNTGIDTKKAALLAFSECELTVKTTNERIRTNHSVVVEPIFHRAQRLVARVLGEFDIRKFDGEERWGPGASTDLRRSKAYLDTKITELPIPVTTRARRYLDRCIRHDPHWVASVAGSMPEGSFCLTADWFVTVDGSNIETVPKTSKTDRTIAVEPRGNMFLQKAVGRYLRSRLKLFGVNLDSQALNQDLAKLANELQLATIDLSMASDSVSIELVYALLPVDWAIYLDDIRSHRYKLPHSKEWVKFEKFSSMGNGFTFELETLLFWALSKASMEGDGSIAVYGDDIIVPRKDAAVLISTLAFSGFTVNGQKSFIDGNFFESCGKHYFQGIDVTPMYQKEVLTDLASDIRFINRVARFLMRSTCDDRLCGPWLDPWRRAIRERIRPGVPLLPFGVEGDEGYLVNHEYLPVKARYVKNYGYEWNVSQRVSGRVPANDNALLAYVLRQKAGADPGKSERLFLDGAPYLEESYDGFLGSRDQDSGKYSFSTRWIEPPWEFALD